MKLNQIIKFMTLVLFAAMLSLPPTALALAGPAQSTASPQATQNDHATLQLGKVEVKGQRQIIKTLQAIKVALRQPESSDPKLANVVVCRITNNISSHASQLLVCATNRTLSQRRHATQIAMRIACPSMTCDIGQVAASDTLTPVLMNFQDRVMSVSVNGAALKAVLEKIPDPTPPPAATTHR